MPRTVPGGIAALRGQKNVRDPIFLVEIQFPGNPRYFSSGEQVTWGGHVWEKNRVMSIQTLEVGSIDRKNQNFSDIEIKFDNLADDGSSNWPFTVLEAGQNLEDATVYVHVYSPDAGDAISKMAWGYTGGRKYSGSDKTVTLSASFFWRSLDAPLPTKLLSQAGFGASDQSSANTEDNQDELAVPIVYGVNNFKIRPTIVRKLPDGNVLRTNFVLSGCNGQPFSVGDVTAAETKLFSTQPATAVEFLTGTHGQAAPANITRFPDAAAHPDVAYGYAEFAIPNESKNKYDNVAADEIKMTIGNGRPLMDTTLPSENPVMIVRDILRDPNFGMGFPAAVFDTAALTAAANYAGTRYQMRFELHKQKSASDLVQYCLANFHGFITFENGLIQVRCKQNNEASVATFATSDSGVSGLKIHDDFVDVNLKDSSELINQVTVKYRKKKRNNRITTLFDPNAQTRAGGTYKKVVDDTFDFSSEGGVFDETQAQILAAIAVREAQNGNLPVPFSSPLWDSIHIAIGDVITVRSTDIFGNAANNTFRVLGQSIDTEGDYLIHFQCEIYKSAIYNDDSVGLGVDLLRGGEATDAQGRPADVIPISLQIVSVGAANDTEGKQATLRYSFTVPAFDASSEQSEGIFREPPMSEVECWVRYTDEPINAARLVASMRVYQTATSYNTSLDFLIDYYKSRSVEAFLVALAPNRARSPLGYIADPTKTTYLAQNITSGGNVAFFVGSTAGMSAGSYLGIEKEINKIAVLGPIQINVEPNVPGPRATFLDTITNGHPTGTEVSQLKLSYPSLTKSLNVPRFGYPAVTQLALHQRELAVKVVIGDVSAENVEDYATYYTVDSAAATDPAKLGLPNPAWYLANPLAPPNGVTLVLGKALHFEIPEEQIGPAGTKVYARCAARNGKHNWSGDGAGNPLLSPLVNNAPGDDAVPAANTPRVVVKKRGLRVVEPMPVMNVKTLQKIEVVIQARNGAGAILGYLTDDFTSQAPNEYRFNLNLGNSELFQIGQDTVLAIWPSAATLKIGVYLTNAVGTSPISTFATVDVSIWETLAEGAVVPGQLQFPTAFVATPNVSSLSANTVDGDPEKGMARLVFDVYTANLLGLDVNNIDAVAFAMVERNADNTADVGKRFSQELTLGVSSFNTFGRSIYLPMGRRYRLLQVISINGDKRAVADGIMDLVSGGVITVAPGDAKVVPAPTFIAQPSADGNKSANFIVRQAQNGTDIILFKSMPVEISFGGGPYRLTESGPVGLKALDDLHSSANPAIGFHDFPISCKRKPGVTLDVRVSSKAIGGKLSAVVNATQLAPSTDDMAVDTAFPNNGAPLVVTHATIKNGRNLIVRIVMPTAQMASHVTNYLIIHDNNATGAGRRFFEPATGLWVTTYSDGSQQMDIEKGGVPSLNAPLSALTVGGRTRIYIVVGVKNAFNGGSTTYSVDVPAIGAIGNIDLSTGGAEPVDQDTAVPDPSALTAVMRFDAKFAVIETPLPTANMATFTKVELAIKAMNGGSTIGWLTRDVSGHYAFSPTEVFFDMGRGKEYSLNLKKVSLTTLFTGITNLEFYYFVSNGNGRSASSSIHTAPSIDLITDYLSARGVPNVIDVAVSGYTDQNLVDNGEFDKNDASVTTQVLNWYRWQNGSLAVAGPNYFGIRFNSPGIIWSKTQCNIAITDGSWYLVRPIGQILKPGLFYSLVALLRTAINGFATNTRAWIIKDGAVSSPGTSSANLDAANLLDNRLILWRGTETGGLSSALYKAGGNYRQCPFATDFSSGGIYPNLWLVIGAAVVPSPNQLILTRIKLTASTQPSAHSPALGEVSGVVDVGGTGIIPGNVGSFPDVRLPSGEIGGYGTGGGEIQF